MREPAREVGKPARPQAIAIAPSFDVQGLLSLLQAAELELDVYEGELPPERSFYFKGPERKLNLRARNLIQFLQLAEGIDVDTWTFHLKSAIHYSPPLQSFTVRSADIIRALEREACSACAAGGYSFYYSVIKGFDAFSRGSAGHISGLSAPNATTLIVFRGIQGVAGALLVPSSLAVLTATFTLWYLFFDAIHHRGQLSTYIRPMGGKVRSIYGPSGDDPRQ